MMKEQMKKFLKQNIHFWNTNWRVEQSSKREEKPNKKKVGEVRGDKRKKPQQEGKKLKKRDRRTKREGKNFN